MTVFELVAHPNVDNSIQSLVWCILAQTTNNNDLYSLRDKCSQSTYNSSYNKTQIYNDKLQCNCGKKTIKST